MIVIKESVEAEEDIIKYLSDNNYDYSWRPYDEE